MNDAPAPKPSGLRVVDFDRSVGKELVELLKRKLDEAERGEIASFACACEYTDGGFGREYVIGDWVSVYKLLGIVTAFKDWISEAVRSNE